MMRTSDCYSCARNAEFDQLPPRERVGAMVLRALDPDTLHSWSAREALASRGDEIALHGLLVGVQYAVLNAVLAINRVYQPHRLVKWQRQLLSGLEVTPARLADRLHVLASPPPAAETLHEAEALLTETADLAERLVGIDLGEFRAVVRERRAAIDPPGPAS